ncbi:MAG: restriction endonuclease, partial [Chloroflexota bacterium]
MNDYEDPTWLVYERCVAALTTEQYDSLKFTVQPNVKLIGQYSEVERQIDVLIDSRWRDQIDRRIIVDAKYRKRKLDVKDVEAFEGMLKDCRANRGIIVCTSGYSKAAFRRAQDAITISIIDIDDLEEYDWVYEKCLGLCSQRHSSK